MLKAFALAVLLSSCLVANSFEFVGYRWQQPVIQFSFSDEYPEDARNVMRTAMKAWEDQALHGAISFQEIDRDSEGVGVLALAWDTTPIVYGKSQILSTVNLHYVKNVLQNGSILLNGSAFNAGIGKLDLVSFQDIGIVLGLQYQTSNPDAIMFSDAKDAVLKTDDLAGIAALYYLTLSDYDTLVQAFWTIGQEYQVLTKFPTPAALKHRKDLLVVSSGQNLYYFDSATKALIGSLPRGKRFQFKLTGRSQAKSLVKKPEVDGNITIIK